MTKIILIYIILVVIISSKLQIEYIKQIYIISVRLFKYNIINMMY